MTAKRRITWFSCSFLLFVLTGMIVAAEPSLTLYNQQFAVIREQIKLPVAKGITTLSFDGITAHLEPESVLLREPAGALRVLEQNYRNDPASEALLLQHFEGQVIDFETTASNGEKSIVRGKIVRAPYLSDAKARLRYGNQYEYMRYQGRGNSDTPIIEVDGKLRFSLPGQPLFPALSDDSILKPQLHWKLASDRKIETPLELSYVSGGFNWSADYNLVLPEKGDILTLTGWVTMDNQSGRSFKDATIKLMAGDVKKIQNQAHNRYANMKAFAPSAFGDRSSLEQVTEKTFDEYHLYSLPRKTDLLDGETKQVEFINADDVKSNLVYIYNGMKVNWDRYRGWNLENIRDTQSFGMQANKKVWVYREFENTKENNLDIPLPKGRIRFYRQDSDKQLEFIGENEIDHSPAREKVKVYTGDAFDLVGDRQRTNYKRENNTLTESFKITVRNRKKETVEIRVVETPYRWPSWEILEQSALSKKVDSNTVEWLVKLEPDMEEVITYTVRYSW
jgi:hypothetical protein